MSEPNELIPMILAAAVASAGPRGTNEGQWMAKVNDAIPPIAAMMHDGSRQWGIASEVLGAAVFVGTYVDHHVEESSTRVVVRIDTGKATKNYPDGIEPIRTHRTDNAQGRSMKERLDRLTAGDEIVVWKALESMGDGADANKVRVLVHFSQRPKRTPSGEPASPSTAREQRADHAPPAAPEALTDSTNSKRLQMWRTGARETLTADEYEELCILLRQSGFDFDGVSEVEWNEYVRPLIRGLVKERNQ